MLRTLALLSVLFVANCSAVTGAVTDAALSTITGGKGGPSLEAQIGRENIRENTISGITNDVEGDQINQNEKVSADTVETVTINEVPVWAILLLVVGFLLPSPGEIGRVVRNRFNKK